MKITEPIKLFYRICARLEQDGHNTQKLRGTVLPILRSSSEIEEFDVVLALYKFGQDWHGGQWSMEYALMGATELEGFTPSHLGVTLDDSPAAEYLYDAMVKDLMDYCKVCGGEGWTTSHADENEGNPECTACKGRGATRP